jgi:hypothetical protein
MADHGERLGLGHRSRLTTGAIAVAVTACLGTAGCSAGATSAAPSQGPKVAATSSSGAGLRLPNAGISGLGASPSEIATQNPVTGPPADPFAGTPADHWADGAAGIVLPAARPIGPFTTAQVASAYQTTRKMLIAADLDKQTLLGGAPTAFADLLADADRTWFLDGLNLKGTDKSGTPRSTRSEVVSFAPGSTQLIGSVIKVHGTMYAMATTDDGSPELDIHVDYLFTYAVEPPHDPENWMRLVSEAAWVLSFGDWQGDAGSFEPWFSTDGDDGVSGNSCGNKDGYVHPDWPSNRQAAQPSVSASGKPVDAYALGQSRSATCESTSGT